MLRKIALDFGLEVSSKFKKRAIQFGYEPAAGAGLKNEVEEFIKTFSTVDGNEGLS